MSPLLIAHRGDSAHAPENTLAAFEQAVARGADMIEMDLGLSADGQVMVHHDRTLTRRAGIRRRIDRMSAEALARVDVSRGFADVPFAPVPRLDEVLGTVGRSVPLYLELKSDGGGRRHAANRRLLEACLRLVPRHSPHVLASFDPGLVRGAMEAGRAGVLILSDPARFLRLDPRERRRLHAVSARWDLLTPSFVERVRRTGTRLWCWTVDGSEAITSALDRGAHGVCCNDVAAARTVLDTYRRKDPEQADTSRRSERPPARGKTPAGGAVKRWRRGGST